MNVFELELSEQEILRRQSLGELRRLGIDPYPAAEYPTNAFSTDITENFSDDAEPREVCIEHHALTAQREDAALDEWLQGRHRAVPSRCRSGIKGRADMRVSRFSRRAATIPSRRVDREPTTSAIDSARIGLVPMSARFAYTGCRFS
jgi:hypothetical protein